MGCIPWVGPGWDEEGDGDGDGGVNPRWILEVRILIKALIGNNADAFYNFLHFTKCPSSLMEK